MDNDDNVDQVHYVPKQLSASQFYKNAESTLKSVRNEWTGDNIGVAIRIRQVLTDDTGVSHKFIE